MTLYKIYILYLEENTINCAGCRKSKGKGKNNQHPHIPNPSPNPFQVSSLSYTPFQSSLPSPSPTVAHSSKFDLRKAEGLSPFNCDTFEEQLTDDTRYGNRASSISPGPKTKKLDGGFAASTEMVCRNWRRERKNNVNRKQKYCDL